MDDVVNRFARELADAIAKAAEQSPEVAACRERALAAGYQMSVQLEANIGFAPRCTERALVHVPKAPRQGKATDITANDRRFLRSLRINPDQAADEAAENA